MTRWPGFTKTCPTLPAIWLEIVWICGYSNDAALGQRDHERRDGNRDRNGPRTPRQVGDDDDQDHEQHEARGDERANSAVPYPSLEIRNDRDRIERAQRRAKLTTALMYEICAPKSSAWACSDVCCAALVSVSEINPLPYWSCAMRAASVPRSTACC